MSLYVYQKQEPSLEPIPETPPSPQTSFLTQFMSHFHLIPTVLSGIGLALMAFVVWPILSYEITNSRSISATTESGLLNPAVEVSASEEQQISAPKIVSDLDYTKAGNWFPQATITNSLSSASNGPDQYTLSIPKLRIEDALVSIVSDDLSQHLIQYPETSLPGKLGSPVIFGHSILPQFYNPKNYLSIFSLLPELEKDDSIIVKYDNTIYTYIVSEKEEVFPEDLWILQQQYDQKRLKLVTCVPPGLKTRRLVVTAILSNNDSSLNP